MNSIIIADDHPLLLKGLKDYLMENRFNLVGEASDGQSAYNLIVKLEPDVAILDIEMPILTGLEVAKKCKTHGISTKIIVITLHKERSYLDQAKELNLFGYLLKDFALDEIEACLHSVFNGKPYFTKQIAGQLSYHDEGTNALAQLTPSERKILKLIAKEHTSKEISEMLFISSRTVDKHRSNIIAKLGLEGKSSALLLWAQRNFDQL